MSVTVRAVLQALDRRQQARQVAALDDLTVAEAEAVREALAGQRAGAKIDLHILVEAVRAEVAKQRRAEAERLRADAPMMAFRYELSLMSLPQLVAARENLLAGDDVRTAIARARREIGQEGQSTKQPPSRPRSLPRAPSRRARPEPVDDSVPGPILARPPDVLSPPSPPVSVRLSATRRLLGPRLFCAGDVDSSSLYADFDRWRPAGRPRWLLAEDDEGEETKT